MLAKDIQEEFADKILNSDAYHVLQHLTLQDDVIDNDEVAGTFSPIKLFTFSPKTVSRLRL